MLSLSVGYGLRARGWTLLALGCVSSLPCGCMRNGFGPAGLREMGPAESANDYEQPVDTGDAARPAVLGSWVLLSAGNFTMGSPTSEVGRTDDEGPQRQVNLTRPFWMMTTEVTQAWFEQVLGYSPSRFAACGPSCPVEGVSWHEGAAYANGLSDLEGRPRCYSCVGTLPQVSCTTVPELDSPYDCPGYRLPTEAEWEYAARSGDPRATSHGDLDVTDCSPSAVLSDIAWYCDNAGGSPHPVGSKTGSPWGLFDMHANLWEWCNDWYGPYEQGPAVDPSGPPNGGIRILRGGCWNCQARVARSAERGYGVPDSREPYFGFRIVRSVPQPAQTP